VGLEGGMEAVESFSSLTRVPNPVTNQRPSGEKVNPAAVWDVSILPDHCRNAIAG
jgi:hypothetical protein